MKVGTAIGGTIVGLAVILGVQGYVSNRPDKHEQHQTVTMPQAERKAPKGPGGEQFFATIQLCWRPVGTNVSVAYILGGTERGAQPYVAGTCSKPWLRTGFVKVGQTIFAHWEIPEGVPLTDVQYRVVVNGWARLYSTSVKRVDSITYVVSPADLNPQPKLPD